MRGLLLLLLLLPPAWAAASSPSPSPSPPGRPGAERERAGARALAGSSRAAGEAARAALHYLNSRRASPSGLLALGQVKKATLKVRGRGLGRAPLGSLARSSAVLPGLRCFLGGGKQARAARRGRLVTPAASGPRAPGAAPLRSAPPRRAPGRPAPPPGSPRGAAREGRTGAGRLREGRRNKRRPCGGRSRMCSPNERGEREKG